LGERIGYSEERGGGAWAQNFIAVPARKKGKSKRNEVVLDIRVKTARVT